MPMSITEAIRILDPKTSAKEIFKIEMNNYGNERGAVLEKVTEACEIACKIMKKYHWREI